MKQVVILPLALMLLTLSGCLLIHTTEHRVQLRADGSGEALLRLVDIRSDGETDSAAALDLEGLIMAMKDERRPEFERNGRRITTKQMFARGETLIVEVAYTFPALDAVEGLRLVDDELVIVVSPEREVISTNGRMEKDENGSVHIAWDADERRLQFAIRERQLPRSSSLGRLYSESLR